MVIPTELEIFYHDLGAKALLLVIPPELEIFYRDLEAKALLLVIPTRPDFVGKALVLVNIDTSTERLSTLSSPFMVLNILLNLGT